MKTMWVKAGKDWVDVDNVEILNVEEGLYGDIYTFIYNDFEYSSQAVIGSRPG